MQSLAIILIKLLIFEIIFNNVIACISMKNAKTFVLGENLEKP